MIFIVGGSKACTSSTDITGLRHPTRNFGHFPSLYANQFFKTIPLSITNKMQRYAIFFITVNALHVSGGFSAHHQGLKTLHTASGICQACLLLLLAVAASKLDIYPSCVYSF
jgi:hypothetical protein